MFLGCVSVQLDSLFRSGQHGLGTAHARREPLTLSLAQRRGGLPRSFGAESAGSIAVYDKSGTAGAHHDFADRNHAVGLCAWLCFPHWNATGRAGRRTTNGATGVLASVAGLMFSMSLGINVTLQ